MTMPSDMLKTFIKPMHPEGIKFVAIFGLVTLLLFWLWDPLGWIGVGLFALFTLLNNLPQYFSGENFSFYGILPDLQATPSGTLSQGMDVAAPYLIALILFAVLTLIPQL